MNHVHIAAVGMLRRVAHGTHFNLRRAGGNTYNHTERGREPVVLGRRLLDKAADHQFGGIEVGDHTFAQRAHRADARVTFAFHQVSLLADSDQLVGPVVQSHYRRFVDYDFVVVDNNRICGAKVDGYFFGKREKSHL